MSTFGFLNYKPLPALLAFLRTPWRPLVRRWKN